LTWTRRSLSLGQLLLDRGVPAFTDRSLEATGPATALYPVTVGYHNGWWPLPGHDLAAMGDHGQIMVVAPTTGTVVVRTGDDDRATSSWPPV
jgi:CubicO group peptidase (beta-lactamase class C family)